MKRFSLFFAAIMAATMSFATVTYELNGGVTNEYGWTSPDDMFAAFMTETGLTGFNTLTEYKALADPLPGICTPLAHPETAFANAAKWGWLKSYIEGVHAAQASDGASALAADGSGAAWRYAVAAFFVDGQRTTWPKSANFSTCGAGTPSAFMATWEHAYANPTEPTATVELYPAYRAGYTFDGWYANADFSGAKVTTVDASTTGTLYANWVEYIPTIAEVKAMADQTTTKVQGVITFINGKNVYIQDATGGMLIYLKANATYAVGEKAVFSGNLTTYGGAPEIASATEVSHEAGTLPKAIVAETLASVCKEANIFTRVQVTGLTIASYDKYSNPFVTDFTDTLQCYKMVLDSTAYPVGTKISVTAVLGYYNKYQFVGDTAGLVPAITRAKDAYVYPARGENEEYTLENKWVYSVKEDNFNDNKPAPSDMARGMAAHNGKMYFINRSNASITVVDGATGAMLAPIKITGSHLFEAEGKTDDGQPNGEYTSAVTLAYNDIKFDGAGHALIGACVSGGQHFMVYKVDLATGAATLVVDERLYDNEDFGEDLQAQATAWRFDAFGVYGDVDNNAIIMAADANSFYAYKWEIENGVAGTATRINCAPDPTTDQSLLISNGEVTVTSFGTAPQIFPVDESYFYVDGWSTLPMLFDMDGMLAEDFISCPTNVRVVNNPGDTCVMNTGHNGLCEFQVGNEYFMVMAATNTATNPESSFALYKFADAAKSFAGIEPLWYFPANGMGALTNGCRTAVPSVEVNGTKATIYLYANNNGYAAYEFTGKEAAAPVEDMWIIGECATASWNPAESKKMTKTADGVFEVTETLTGTWFAFTTVNSADWEVVNSHRFGSNPSGENVSDGAAHAISGVNGDYSFTVTKAGTYKFVVDLNAMTVQVSETTALDELTTGNVEKVVENGQVVIIKNGVRYNVLGAVVE